MTIIKVINHLKKEYERAKSLDFVYKPLSYALYQTWRWCDKCEEEKKNDSFMEANSESKNL